MGRFTAPSDYDYMESYGDHVPRQERSERRRVVPSRPCELCPKTAWFVAASPDGVREFMCASGHQVFVAPVAAPDAVGR